MRIGVVSDTHGDAWAIEACIRAAGAVDAWFHLGDSFRDAKHLEKAGVPVYAVCGNTDALLSGVNEQVAEVGGKRFLLCHGHAYGVDQGPGRVALRAQEKGCHAALFGHTHVPFLNEGGDVLVLNPGSPSRPRGGSRRCMGLLIIEGNSLEGELLTLL